MGSKPPSAASSTQAPPEQRNDWNEVSRKIGGKQTKKRSLFLIFLQTHIFGMQFDASALWYGRTLNTISRWGAYEQILNPGESEMCHQCCVFILHSLSAQEQFFRFFTLWEFPPEVQSLLEYFWIPPPRVEIACEANEARTEALSHPLPCPLGIRRIKTSNTWNRFSATALVAVRVKIMCLLVAMLCVYCRECTLYRLDIKPSPSWCGGVAAAAAAARHVLVIFTYNVAMCRLFRLICFPQQLCARLGCMCVCVWLMRCVGKCNIIDCSCCSTGGLKIHSANWFTIQGNCVSLRIRVSLIDASPERRVTVRGVSIFVRL